MNNLQKQTNRIISILLLLIFVIAGCNTTPTNSNNNAAYRVDAVLIIDPNKSAVNSPTKLLVDFQKESSVLADGTVQYTTNNLIFNNPVINFDSLFSFLDSSTLTYANTAQTITLKDSSSLTESFSIAVPDSFSLGTITDQLIQNNNPILIDWNGSARTQTYVIATVMASKAYTGTGWSQFSTSQTPGGAIPPGEAFSNPDSVSRDTGLYNIYVYAIAGSPSPQIANRFLPVPLPGTSLPDNLSKTTIVGRYGAIYVTVYDTVRVVQIP